MNKTATQESEAKQTIRIMIVDDHPVFGEALAYRLRQEDGLEVVKLAHTVKEASQVLDLAEIPIDLVLLDISLKNGKKDTEGLDLAEDVKKNYSETKVIMLSTHYEGAYIHRMFNAGIDGYVSKNAHTDELIKAINSVSQKRRYYSQEVRDEMEKHIINNKGLPNQAIRLTPTEEYTLSLIAEGMTSKQISQRMGNKETTVEVHRRNLMIKFGVKNVARLITEAIRRGFINVND